VYKETAMQHALRPWISASVVLTGASLIAGTPAATSHPHVQQRAVELTTIIHGDLTFPEVDWDQLVSNTTANWDGLTDMFNNTTAIWDLPSAVYSDGLGQVFTDLYTDITELIAYAEAYAQQVAADQALDPTTVTLPPLPNLFGDPVLNPVSALSILLDQSISSGYAMNAAEAGWEGVYQNMVPSIDDLETHFSDIFTQLGDIFTSGTLDTSAIGTDFTDIVNDLSTAWGYLSLAPTTILNDYLNGYPVQSESADPLSTYNSDFSSLEAYTLNAPYNSTDEPATTLEFGLLTNPDAAITADTGTDGTASSFEGTVPLTTGTLASLLQTEQTLDDELLTVTSTVAGSGVSAPTPTGDLTILGPNSIGFDLNLASIPVIGTAIDYINDTVIPDLNGALKDAVEVTNDAINGFNSTILPALDTVKNYIADVINAVVNPAIHAANELVEGLTAGIKDSGVPNVNVSIPNIPNIPTIPLSDIPSIPSVPTVVGDTFSLPGFTGGSVPAYTEDLTQIEMSILGSIAALAAPVTGTEFSGTATDPAIGNFLAENPVYNLGSVVDSLVSGLLGTSSPLQITATLPLDWSNMIAETLNSLFDGSI
jgi:hypothetical protein